MGAFDRLADASTATTVGGGAAGAKSGLFSAATACVRFGPLHLPPRAARRRIGTLVRLNAPIDSAAPQLGGATPLIVAELWAASVRRCDRAARRGRRRRR